MKAICNPGKEFGGCRIRSISCRAKTRLALAALFWIVDAQKILHEMVVNVPRNQTQRRPIKVPFFEERKVSKNGGTNPNPKPVKSF